MNKNKLLITDKINEDGLGLLDKYFVVEKKYGVSFDELKKIIKNYHTIITRSSTAATKDLFQHAPNLKIVGRAGIGVDNIDIIDATKRSIAVINAPKGNGRATSEHTIGLLFALFRNISQAHADLKKGIWGKQKYVGSQIRGKTLGIVGFGNIGKDVYAMAKAIGMEVIVCEPYLRVPRGIRKVTFEQLLAESDVITLHVPATYLTHHMINKKTIALCKKSAYLINCSRGAVVDENAAIDALKTNRLAGFAVDVFEKEPEVNPELLKLPNVIATPHIAGSTVESQRESVHEVVAGICTYMTGHAPSNLLNPQVFHKTPEKKNVLPRRYDAVIFDCDSTLCTIEGIDELAALVGKKGIVAELTRAAMEGLESFETIYKKRLSLIKPTKAHIAELGQLYITHLAEDAKGTVHALHEAGKKVYIISSGYYGALRELGKALGIPANRIFGNDLLFDEKGDYLDIIGGPLIRNYGKLQIIRQIPGRKVLIGDAVTDYEAREIVDLFIGYGGVITRKPIEKKSEVYIKTTSLSPVLVIAAGLDDCKKLLTTKYKRYVGKGIDLLFHDKHVKLTPSLAKRVEELKELAYY